MNFMSDQIDVVIFLVLQVQTSCVDQGWLVGEECVPSSPVHHEALFRASIQKLEPCTCSLPLTSWNKNDNNILCILHVTKVEICTYCSSTSINKFIGLCHKEGITNNIKICTKACEQNIFLLTTKCLNIFQRWIDLLLSNTCISSFPFQFYVQARLFAGSTSQSTNYKSV